MNKVNVIFFSPTYVVCTLFFVKNVTSLTIYPDQLLLHFNIVIKKLCTNSKMLTFTPLAKDMDHHMGEQET